MQLKSLFKRAWNGTTFLVLIFSAGIVFYVASHGQIKDNSTLLTASVTALYSGQENTANALSARLSIPVLHIDTSIESLGLTAGGAVDVPKGPNDVAWFDLGPKPGAVGDAVIVGHSGWKDGIPAVFDNLSKLKKGDEIYIKNADGSTNTFVVRKTAIYNQTEDVSSVFISTDGKTHLNLITCTGIWNVAEQGRSDRLIVFADLK
jgi:LPXTG-site transpeptidase (sortase) family protein